MMTFNVYRIRGTKLEDVEQELLFTADSTITILNYINNFMVETEFTQSSKNWINEIISLEDNEAHIVRDKAEFKLVQYAFDGPSGWGGLLVEMIRT